MRIKTPFWDNVNIRDRDECWEWAAGRCQKNGYGKFGIDGKTYVASRFVWALIYGPIPRGLFVLHSCDNPPCCNPEHLFLGTQADNIRDRDRKGRGNGGARRGELHGRTRLTEKDVLLIRFLYSLKTVTQIELGKQFHVAQRTVAHIVNRTSWNHI